MSDTVEYAATGDDERVFRANVERARSGSVHAFRVSVEHYLWMADEIAKAERLAAMLTEAHEKWEQCLDKIERLQGERDNLYGYVNGLLGLLQLVRGRDDMTPGLAEVLRTNHRATDAGAYLTQILPPEKPRGERP